MNSFTRELFNKLIAVLHAGNFESHTLNCSTLGDSVSNFDIVPLSNSEPTTFEKKLSEIVQEVPILQFHQNSTYNIEYFLKVMVFGRDGNELPLLVDESPVLTELGTIDNFAFSITPNISLKAPRRFFRIGVAQAIPWSYVKINPKTSLPMLDENGNVMWEGYCIDFAMRLAEKLDFDFVLVPPSNGSFGDRVPGLNHTWDGLVGDLVTGVCQLTQFF